MASPVRLSLAGKWRGGPHKSLITVTVSHGGEVYGWYTCPSGSQGEFSGRTSRSGGSAKGVCYDADLSGAARRSDKQVVEITVEGGGGDGGGATLRAQGTNAKGGAVTWTAVRAGVQARPGSAPPVPGVYKDKTVFERLIAPKDRSKEAEAVRELSEFQFAVRSLASLRGLFTLAALAARRRRRHWKRR